ncbi:MAG: hypothetical protein ACXWUI_15770 [Burkholderiales bacterium]
MIVIRDPPASYIRLFGADFRPEPYVERATNTRASTSTTVRHGW